MREVDGLRVAFVEHDSYFESFTTPSMGSTARATGAQAVFLLGPGKTAADVTDDDIRAALGALQEQPHERR